MPRRGSSKPPAEPVVKPYGCDCFEYQYTYEDKKTGSQREASFEWITDIEVDERNIEEMIKADAVGGK